MPLIDVHVPALGEAAAEARVLRWTCRVGDHVRAGQTIAEIETEKANIEVDAPADGIIESILVPADSIFRGDVVLARLTPHAFDANAVLAADRRGPTGVEPMVRLPGAPTSQTQRRCKFCNALEMSGRIDCARCGAPL